MGASLVYLNEPNTEIEHEVGQNDYLKFAAGSMQGWRLNMVSAITKFVVLRLQIRLSTSNAGQLGHIWARNISSVRHRFLLKF